MGPANSLFLQTSATTHTFTALLYAANK